MRLLVTGGCGFIASNFIRYWFKNHPQDEIINLDLLTYAANPGNLADIAELANYRFVQGNICDAILVEKLVSEVDIVINLAAETHVDRSILGAEDFVQTNIIGTFTLLEAIKKYQKRFHQISTDEVYGDLQDQEPAFNENSPYRPSSPYSASKASADHLVRSYFRTFKLPVTISNCSNNYGPYQFPEKLIPFFATNLIENKKVPVYGSGKNVRDWIHVDDHNAGIEAILQKGKMGETYCLGGGQEMNNLEITQMILNFFGKDQAWMEFVEDRKGHDWRYAINYQKAKQELGWSPQINFAQGLEQTLTWYQSHESWWKALKNRA